ncbi:hypothetical protein GCM10028856_26440 [Halopiger thermotolerans]
MACPLRSADGDRTFNQFLWPATVFGSRHDGNEGSGLESPESHRQTAGTERRPITTTQLLPFLEETIRAGIEAGTSREVDPAEPAALFAVVTTGSTVQRATGSDEVLADAAAAFDQYVQTHLLESDESPSG